MNLEIFNGLSKAFTFFADGLEPVEVPSECGIKKVYALIQNACFCTVIISSITAIFSASISSLPIFLISISLFTISYVGSSHLKQMLYEPPLPLSYRRMKVLEEDQDLQMAADHPPLNTTLVDHLFHNPPEPKISQSRLTPEEIAPKLTRIESIRTKLAGLRQK